MAAPFQLGRTSWLYLLAVFKGFAINIGIACVVRKEKATAVITFLVTKLECRILRLDLHVHENLIVAKSNLSAE